MSRPATAPKHEGAPCKRCGGTLYYDRNDYCVECTRIHNAATHPPRTPTTRQMRVKDYQTQIRAAHYKAKGEGVPELSPTSSRILSALSRDAHAAVQRQARMYLGITKHMQEAKASPMTAGDVWRSLLPVGVPPPAILPNDYNKSRPRRATEYLELAAAVAALLPTMNDVVRAADVILLLDPEMVETFGARMGVNLARAMAAAGAKRLPMKGGGGIRTTYFLRCADAYRGMSGRAIMAHHASGTRTEPGDPVPVGEPRGQGRRRKGVPPATPEELRERKRQRERAKAARKAARAAAGANMAADRESSLTGTADPLTPKANHAGGMASTPPKIVL